MKMKRVHLFLECSFIGKIEERIDPTGVLTKRRKEGTLDTENKNGCFRWTWLMNWTVWKLRNHISYTEGIQGINPPERQALSSHQDNFYCKRKIEKMKKKNWNKNWKKRFWFGLVMERKVRKKTFHHSKETNFDFQEVISCFRLPLGHAKNWEIRL